MTVDIQKLKALAEAATPGPWECREVDGLAAICHDHGWIGDNEISDSQDLADSRYMAAANPAAVLGMIAENERLASRVKLLEGYEAEFVRIANDAEAERDQFKAVNVTLRQSLQVPSDLLADAVALEKDAERLAWLDTQYTNVVEGHGEYAEIVAIRWVVEGQCSTVREAIDDAMAKDMTHD